MICKKCFYYSITTLLFLLRKNKISICKSFTTNKNKGFLKPKVLKASSMRLLAAHSNGVFDYGSNISFLCAALAAHTACAAFKNKPKIFACMITRRVIILCFAQACKGKALDCFLCAALAAHTSCAASGKPCKRFALERNPKGYHGPPEGDDQGLRLCIITQRVRILCVARA